MADDTDLPTAPGDSQAQPAPGGGQDYTTLQQTYQDGAQALQDKWAGTISNPAMRELFVARTKETIAQGNAVAAKRAFALEGNSTIANVQQLGDDLTTKAVQDPTNDTLTSNVMQTYGGMVDGLQGRGFITPEAALAMKQQYAQRFAYAHAISRSQVDPLGTLNEVRAAPGSPEQIDNRTIQVESGGNPLAASTTSSAFGLGQFTAQTWLDLIKQTHPELVGQSDAQLLALRADPGLSKEMVAANRVQNTAYMQRNGIEQPTAGNIYLAHFLGPADATKVLQADPNMPVESLLDPKVVAANRSVLAGKTAGTVAQWAEGRMGGVGPGGGHLYDILRPDQRARLEEHALGQLQAQTTSTVAGFRNSIQDDIAEAGQTGGVMNPKTPEQFVATYGPQAGPLAYQNYTADVQAGSDSVKFASMPAADIKSVVDSYAPAPGVAGYAAAEQRQAALDAAARQIMKERQTDPATYAVNRLPVVSAAFQQLARTVSDPTVGQDVKQAAARDFATKTLMEQERLGIPPEAQAILPKNYLDQFSTSIGNAASSEDPGARVGLIARIQNEAKLWGDQWPLVMRQLAPGAQPIVRAVAAGADPAAMTRLLSLGKGDDPVKQLKETDGVKASNIDTSLNTVMAPFRSTLVGRQLDRDYPGYYGLAEKLAAIYARDGKAADDSATAAFNALIGNRYDFKDTYRIPKSAGVSPDDVQAGAQYARGQLEQLGAKPAVADVPGLSDNSADSFQKFGRDGKWITSPDNSGLNMVYGDKFVRRQDGSPLLVPWKTLGDMSKTGSAIAAPQAISAANAMMQ